MAIVVGELFLAVMDEIITDFAIDGIVIDASLTEEAIVTIQSEIVAQIEGGSTDVEALTSAYNSVAELDSTVASQLAFRLAEEGFQISEGNVVEQAAISNGAIEANNSGVPDEEGFQKLEPDDTPDVSKSKVAANTANAAAGTRSGLGILGYLGAGSITVILIAALAFFNIIFNAICSTVCYLSNKLFSSNTVHCQGASTYTCCSNTKCSNAMCQAIKNIRIFLKKYEYQMIILVPIVIIGLGIAFYDSIGIVWPIIISVFWIGFVLLMCSVLGYLLINAFCGLGDIATILNYL